MSEPTTPAPELVVVVSGHGPIGEACARDLLALGSKRRRVVLVGAGTAAPGVVHRPVPPGVTATAVLEEVAAELGPVLVLAEIMGRTVPGAHPVPGAAPEPGALAELEGVVERIRLVTPAMAEAGHGRVVLVAEASGVPGRTWDDVGAAASWGLVGLARSATREAAGSGITVNVVRAGVVDTDELRALREADPLVAEAVDASVAATPLRRLASVDEVAATVSYLASDEAGFVTGVVIPVDGGLTMGLGS